jgi:hypothetical protein
MMSRLHRESERALNSLESKVAGSNPARPTIFPDTYKMDRQVTADRLTLRE